MTPRKPMDRAGAEDIAVASLGFLTSDEERLGRFLAASGLNPDTIRAAAASPGFFAGVLDFIATDEALLLAFAGEIEVSPERIMDARHVLSPAPDD